MLFPEKTVVITKQWVGCMKVLLEHLILAFDILDF